MCGVFKGEWLFIVCHAERNGVPIASESGSRFVCAYIVLRFGLGFVSLDGSKKNNSQLRLFKGIFYSAITIWTEKAMVKGPFNHCVDIFDDLIHGMNLYLQASSISRLRETSKRAISPAHFSSVMYHRLFSHALFANSQSPSITVSFVPIAKDLN